MYLLTKLEYTREGSVSKVRHHLYNVKEEAQSHARRKLSQFSKALYKEDESGSHFSIGFEEAPKQEKIAYYLEKVEAK